MTLLGIARFSIPADTLDEFKRLSHQAMSRVKDQDTRTLRYEIYLNASQTEAIVIEEYADEAAMHAHAEHIGDDLMQRIAELWQPHGEILGEVSDDLRDELAGGPVQPFRPFLSAEV